MDMRMPGMPASPKNNAYSDQPNAASTPMLMRVSMVVEPWRAVIAAARWNGHAPHTATGAASVSTSHCQLVNWRAGIIDSTGMGRLSAAVITSLFRKFVSSASGSLTDPVLGVAVGGAGIAALKH